MLICVISDINQVAHPQMSHQLCIFTVFWSIWMNIFGRVIDSREQTFYSFVNKFPLDFLDKRLWWPKEMQKKLLNEHGKKFIILAESIRVFIK